MEKIKGIITELKKDPDILKQVYAVTLAAALIVLVMVIKGPEEQGSLVTDSSGNVVITYVQRNETISSVSFGAESEGFLPIHVKTKDHIRAAQRQVDMTNAVFAVVYILEVLACFFAYFLLRTPKKSTRTA
jgi:hypothetical protein